MGGLVVGARQLGSEGFKKTLWWTGTDWSPDSRDAMVYDHMSIIDGVIANLAGKEPDGFALFGTNTRES